jgi:hypothetical protein
MWTAPPPMIAPPAVHAQSFAKAIRTDISRTLFRRGRRREYPVRKAASTYNQAEAADAPQVQAR